jgi:hypothetical protein
MRELTSQLAAHITADTLLVASSELVSCDVSGETVLLSLKTASYYGLDPIATRIWELLKDPRTISSVCEILLTEYDVDAERCRNEVIALSEQLINWGLVEVTSVSSALTSPAAKSTESVAGS